MREGGRGGGGREGRKGRGEAEGGEEETEGEVEGGKREERGERKGEGEKSTLFMSVPYLLLFSIMVLDAGRIVEFDPPDELLSNKNGVFFSMAKDAGLAS